MMIGVNDGYHKVLENVKPYAAMLFLNFGFAGMYVISVATLKDGMNQFVLAVYRNVVAVAAIAPFALWFEREGRPKITRIIFLKILALALLEPVVAQNLFYMGTNLTSASFASTLDNMIPAITCLMALIFRAEKFDIRGRRGQAKVFGTLLTVSGVVLMILYKGPVFDLLFSSNARDRQSNAVNSTRHVPGSSMWLKGTFLVIGSSTCWSAFLILQSNTLESYPAELTLTALICTMGAPLSAVVAVAADGWCSRPWVIGWNKRLIAPIYTGVICSGVAYYLQGIVMKQRGPVFVSAFSPLTMIMTAIMGSFILKDKISLGMTLGAIIMVAGLYSLLWGKSKDHVNLSEKNEGGQEQLPVVAPNPINRDPISLSRDPKY